MTQDFLQDLLKAHREEGEPIIVMKMAEGKVELLWENIAKMPIGVDCESVSGRQWVDLITGRMNEMLKRFLEENGE